MNTIRRADHFLVPIDDSDASKRAVQYLASLAESLSGDDVAITLFHMLRMPPRLVEHGGAEKPAEETERERRLAGERKAWVEGEKDEVRPLFDRARQELHRADVRDDRIKERTAAELHGELGAETLRLARELGCGTVVVGRSSFPWYRELTQRHLSDELIDRAEGIAIVVVQ